MKFSFWTIFLLPVSINCLCSCVPRELCNDLPSQLLPCGKNVCCHDIREVSEVSTESTGDESGCYCIAAHLCPETPPPRCPKNEVCCPSIEPVPLSADSQERKTTPRIKTTTTTTTTTTPEPTTTTTTTTARPTTRNPFLGTGGRLKFNKGCGVSNMAFNAQNKHRETSTQAHENEFPWTLQILGSELNDLICGAVLIEYTVVLTAANCVNRLKPSEIIVRGGEWMMNSSIEKYEVEDRNVTDIVVHPSFGAEDFYADIAILFLEKGFKESFNVKTICWPKYDMTYTKSCFATGWGANSQEVSPRAQVIMKMIPLRRIHGAECEDYLRETELGYEWTLANTSICAFAMKGETSLGDGGGPMFCKSEPRAREFVLVGITSYGVRGKDMPGVYTDVDSSREWINSTIYKVVSGEMDRKVTRTKLRRRG